MVKEKKIDKFKRHVKNHQTAYTAVIVGTVSAGITTVIMRGRHAENAMRSGGHDDVTVRLLSIFTNRNTNNIVSVLERGGRGHPGYLTRCMETGEIFASQSQASEIMNIPKYVISKHMMGVFQDANGFHFERILAG